MTELNLASYMLGASAALLVGFSKTGMPGAAIPAVALMAEAFRQDTRLSVGAMLPVLLLGDVFAVAYYRRHAHWNRLLELLPYVIAGMVPGYLVLWLIEGDALRVLLGALVVLLLLLHVGLRRYGWEQVPHLWWFTAAAGALAGFGTAVGNAAGPAMSIYLVSRRLDKHEFLGTAAWFYFLVNLTKIPVFFSLGVVTSTTLSFGLLLAPVLLVGAIAGVVVLKCIPQTAFDTLVLALAGVAAVRMILF